MFDDLKQHIYAWSPASLQNFLLSRVGGQLKHRRFGREYEAWLDLGAKGEAWSETERGDYMDGQVERIIKRAYTHIPYYRKAMQQAGLTPNDIRCLEDLPKLPILSKSDIRQHAATMIADDVDRRGLILGHSSGTTGSPLEFWWDLRVEIAANAMIWRHRNFAGFQFGQPYATLLGRVIVPLSRQRPPFWRFNRPWNQLFLSSFHLQESNIDGYLEAMERHQIRALETYPSNAYLMARHLEARDRRFPLDAVFTSSETLLDVQRELVEDRFACRVFDYYGQAERVMVSGECETHTGHHHFPEFGAVEVLDDKGEPLRSGKPGRLVLTGFANDAMPLIRYEIGDVAGFTDQVCPCGRTLPMLSTIATKAEDIVVTPDGRNLSPSVLTHPFKPMNNIKASQVIQETTSELRILVVRRPDYTEKDTRRLIEAFRERVGEEMNIKVEYVDDIPRGPRGKLRWVVSKVPLRFAGGVVPNLYRE